MRTATPSCAHVPLFAPTRPVIRTFHFIADTSFARVTVMIVTRAWMGCRSVCGYRWRCIREETAPCMISSAVCAHTTRIRKAVYILSLSQEVRASSALFRSHWIRVWNRTNTILVSTAWKRNSSCEAIETIIGTKRLTESVVSHIMISNE